MIARRLTGLVLLAVLIAARPVMAQDSAAQVPSPSRALDDETKCLALAIYWEGKTETRAGQLAVAHTVLNRVKHAKFPDTICGVVSQKAEDGRKRCQFSWWCDGKRDVPMNDTDWEQAMGNARAALHDGAQDPTRGALYFHSARIKPPKWTAGRKKLARIGNHVFYK
ncbi:MAG: cell wall hydrolase [Ferrovibrio sp.]|uniref:cell wall hydrolase n=1 Tax=Ferrovibrio sp. TaxID=1917215 RepID=UPI002626F9FF|nr:cell wall hydrolase [Ferrovibrio sp.]MCW0233672.1 cell wall hydrolase [Ferrovibrio sp.]